MHSVEISIAKIDLSLLHPEMAARLIRLQTFLLAAGHQFFATEGYRTEQRSALLWTYGRTQKNPDWKGAGNGPTVTNALPLQSPHNFGLAVDLTHDSDVNAPGLQPDWKEENYAPLGVLAPQAGLISGVNWQWKDRPHVQLPGFVTADEMLPLAKLWTGSRGTVQDRLHYVWKHTPQLNVGVKP